MQQVLYVFLTFTFRFVTFSTKIIEVSIIHSHSISFKIYEKFVFWFCCLLDLSCLKKYQTQRRGSPTNIKYCFPWIVTDGDPEAANKVTEGPGSQINIGPTKGNLRIFSVRPDGISSPCSHVYTPTSFLQSLEWS